MLPGVSARTVPSPGSSSSGCEAWPSHAFFTVPTPRYGSGSAMSVTATSSPGSVDNLLLRQENYSLRQKILLHEKAQATLRSEVAKLTRDNNDLLQRLSQQHFRAAEACRREQAAKQHVHYMATGGC